MGIIIPEDFFQASFIFTVAGNVKDKVTTLGLQPEDPGSTSPEDVADGLYGLVTASANIFAAASMTNKWTFQGVSVIKQTSSGPLVGTHLDPLPGTISADNPPSNCCLLVKKSTVLGGRKNRGRFYVPAAVIGESTVDAAGFILEAALTAYQTGWDAFHDDLVSTDLTPYLLHSDATAPTVISSFSVESQIGTQRRRLR